MSTAEQTRVQHQLSKLKSLSTLPSNTSRIKGNDQAFVLRTGNLLRLVGAVRDEQLFILDIIDRNYNAYEAKLDNAISLLSRNLDATEIEKLAASASAAPLLAERGEIIQSHHPALAQKIKQLFVPNNPGETWQMIGSLAATAAVILSLNQAQKPSNTDINFIDLPDININLPDITIPIK